jgi:hypothetical protein
MKETNITAQDCIECKDEILAVLVNDDSTLPAIRNYLEWCRKKLNKVCFRNAEYAQQH